MVQLASILAWGASGRPFESGCSDDFRPWQEIVAEVCFFY